MLLYKLFEIPFGSEISSIIFRFSVGLMFISLTLKLTKPKDGFWKFQRLTQEQVGFTFLILLLFALNNYLHTQYGNSSFFAQNVAVSLVVFGYLVNSFFEEFAYRGFIQGYVNQKLAAPFTPLSQGNLFASFLMTATHVGFFQVMDFVFAFSSVFLVLLFSLIMGYLRDKGCSIWFLIVIHTMVNIVHLLFHIDQYM
mgnify:FL=1